LRKNLHSWRVPVGEGGYYLTASDTAPVCHIVGGGPQDFQPGIEALLKSTEFRSRWGAAKQNGREDMISTRFVSKVDPALGLLLSRADRASARTDRGQLVATETYEVSK
jgi:hypothetical protein